MKCFFNVRFEINFSIRKPNRLDLFRDEIASFQSTLRRKLRNAQQLPDDLRNTRKDFSVKEEAEDRSRCKR